MEVTEVKRRGNFENKVAANNKNSGQGRGKANKIRIEKYQLDLDIMSLVTSGRADSQK